MRRVREISKTQNMLDALKRLELGSGAFADEINQLEDDITLMSDELIAESIDAEDKTPGDVD